MLLAVLSPTVVGGAWLVTGTFTCLALVDYVWNAWHFAAQHGGILRIYSRKAGGGRPRLETIGVRTFVTYTSLRLAGWTLANVSGDEICAVLNSSGLVLLCERPTPGRGDQAAPGDPDRGHL